MPGRWPILLKYDSLFGTLEEDVKFESNAIIVGDHEIQLLSGRDPEALDWTSSESRLSLNRPDSLRKPRPHENTYGGP